MGEVLANDERWIGQAEAARILGVTPRRVRTLVERGHLGCLRIAGSHSKVWKPDVESLLAVSFRQRTREAMPA